MGAGRFRECVFGLEGSILLRITLSIITPVPPKPSGLIILLRWLWLLLGSVLAAVVWEALAAGVWGMKLG